MHWIIGKLWPLISWNTLRCCHAKPVVALLIRNNLTLWGLLLHGNAQSNLYSFVWNLKNILLLEFCSKKTSDTPKTETHTVCAFFGVQSSQETPSNVTFIPLMSDCHLDLTEVYSCLEKKNTSQTCPARGKNQNWPVLVGHCAGQPNIF